MVCVCMSLCVCVCVPVFVCVCVCVCVPQSGRAEVLRVLPGRVDGRKGDLRRVSRVSPGSSDVSSEDEDVVWNTPDLEPD